MLQVKSNYEGYKGIYADKDIVKGDIIHNLSGFLSNDRSRESIEILVQIQGLAKTMHIEDSFFEYCNHSSTPNVKINKYTHDVIALKDIKKGEEITFDYTNHESDISSPFIDSETGEEIGDMGNYDYDARIDRV